MVKIRAPNLKGEIIRKIKGGNLTIFRRLCRLYSYHRICGIISSDLIL
jgi:hypothetical protein